MLSKNSETPFSMNFESLWLFIWLIMATYIYIMKVLFMWVISLQEYNWAFSFIFALAFKLEYL